MKSLTLLKFIPKATSIKTSLLCNYSFPLSTAIDDFGHVLTVQVVIIAVFVVILAASVVDFAVQLLRFWWC